MRRYSVPEWWSVDVPDGWRVTEHAECTTFESPAGDSAVQISAHRKEGAVTDDDLRDFADGAPLTPAAFPHFTGFQAASTGSQVFARKLWLRAGELLVFVTYTCSLGARGREDAVLDEMLRSLSSGHAAQQA